MPTKDTSPIKESILEFLKTNGPSLPVQISRHIKMDTIFASAFLSELLSQKKIKITNMKVGGSPVYYIQGTEEKLEKYAQEYLKSKEKDAFVLLQQKKYLIDLEQEPAIRIALRSIKDFAKPIERGGKIIWKYFTKKEEIPEQKKEQEKSPHVPNSIITNIKKELEKPQVKKPIKKKTTAKTKVQDKKNERFFNKVKEYLVQKEIEITDIIGFSKGDLTLKIKQQETEKILIAYNKKRLTELDITNAYKKAKDYQIPYIIISLGEPAKKTINLIDAIKQLSSIEKLE